VFAFFVKAIFAGSTTGFFGRTRPLGRYLPSRRQFIPVGSVERLNSSTTASFFSQCNASTDPLGGAARPHAVT
jgi:hypothetical protein